MEILEKISQGNPVMRRLINGVGANFIGKVWLLLAQLINVPVMTYHWGVEGYGIWLLIATIPTYLAMSDFGLAMAGQVEVTSAVTRNDLDGALRSFQTVWAITTAISGVVALSVFFGVLLWLLLSAEGGGELEFGRDRIALTICLMTVSALLALQMNIVKIAYLATHRYALGTFIFDVLFFAGWLLVLISIIAGGDIVWAAAVQCGGRLVSFVFYDRIRHRLEPWCAIGTRHFDFATLRRLFSPSLAALSLAFANSFGLQAVVVTIGWSLGPAAAAVFATSRLLTRIPLQLSGLMTRASLPEMTRSQVDGDRALLQWLMRLNVWVTLAAMVPSTVVLVLFGPTVLSFISHGKMNASPLTFAILAAASTCCAIWTTLGARLISLNLQHEFSYLALALYFATALVPFVSGGEIFFVLLAILISDFLIALRVYMVRPKGVE